MNEENPEYAEIQEIRKKVVAAFILKVYGNNVDSLTPNDNIVINSNGKVEQYWNVWLLINNVISHKDSDEYVLNLEIKNVLSDIWYMKLETQIPMVQELIRGTVSASNLLTNGYLSPEELLVQGSDTVIFLEHVTKVIKHDSKVAVLGARTGLAVEMLLNNNLDRNVELTLIDESAGMLKRAEERLRRYDVQFEYYHFEDGLLEKSLLGQFDFVIALGELHRYKNPLHGLHVANMLLKAKGQLLALEYEELDPMSIISSAILENGFSEYMRKRKNTALMTVDEWLTAFEESAFDDVKSGLIRKRNDGKFEAIENVEWSQKEQQWNVAFDKWYDKLGNVSTLEYIKLNADEFANIMSGKTDPVSLLYPDGSNKYTQALYVENTATKYINASICKIIKKVQKRVPGQKIKILEVGAGTGATTEWVFKALEGSEFEYCFTDISKYFFPDAVNRFGKNPNVTIKKLDLNEDFVAQGFCPNSYDVIIGAYVLNNVKDIVKTINKLKELVRNEGYLIFSETILPETWLLVSQALMMTPPEDTLRDGAAFISKDLWCGVLKESDGVEESVLSIPSNNNPTSLLGAGLFIKQFKRTDVFLDKMEINRRLEKYLPAYMLPSEICIIDRIPLSANGKIDRKAVEDWFERYRISEDKIAEKEETKTDLEKMICQIWCEALDIGDLGRKENFYDYGADSLIMAQVTTKVRSKLEKEIPFDALLRQMLNTPTIEEIALYISAYDNQEIESPMCEKKFEYIAKNGERNGNRGRILLHGALGSVDVYRYLIPEMEKQNCGEIISIGISDLDEYCKLESEEVVLHLADLYTQKILEENLDKVQIVGYSFSGVIAIEMAKQLLEAGIDVEDVAIIDGGSIPVEIQDEIIYELFFIGNLHVSLEKLEFTDLKVFEKIFGKIVDSKQDSISISDFEDSQEDCHIYERLLELSQLTQEVRFKTYLSVSDDSSVRNFNFDMVKHLYTIFKKSFAALRFVPTVYFGDIRYFKTTERNGIFKYFEALLQEWDDVCIGDFEIIEIAGNHYSCLENPNYAHELAKKLGSVYEEWREE